MSRSLSPAVRLSLLLFLFSLQVFASGGHHHGGDKAIGEGKAIVDVDEKKGFKLSSEAIETLGIKSKRVNDLPPSALVIDRDERSFYVLRDGYFRLLKLSELKTLRPEDEVVVEGVGLLRITDVYSTDESEYGHAH